ncbi:MAG: amidohydrolase family protein [Armatimonadetes bacterium]|nr:amidohydrolase family protein [Armatimonadota bacterium]
MLPYFDANVMLGRMGVPVPGMFETSDALLKEMDRLGIQEALVYSSLSKENHPSVGNAEIIRQVKGYPRLHPCWVWLPPGAEEVAPSARFVADMRRDGVRALRFFPNSHKYPVTAWNLGSLFEILEAHQIPVILDHESIHWSDDRIDASELLKIGEAFPELTIILAHASHGMLRWIFPLMEGMPGLRLETCYFQPNNGLEEIVRRCGPERLIFGTGMPAWSPGPPMQMLECACIPGESRIKVAGNNMRSLLGLPLAEAQSPDGYRKAAMPVGKAFDAHGHLGEWHSTVIFGRGTPDNIAHTLDGIGVSGILLSDMVAIGPDFRKGNDRVAEAVARFPGKIYGYAVVNPHYPDEMIPELERCFDQMGFTGIKFHCGLHQYHVDGPNYRPAIEFADERGLGILIHGYGPMRVLDDLARRYPMAKFLSAHIGGWNGVSPDDSIELAKRHPNIYLDLASSACYFRSLERMVAEVGSRQIIHGSDMPLMDPAYQLGRVTKADISDEAKRDILANNARRVFGV